jgi:MFS family permease
MRDTEENTEGKGRLLFISFTFLVLFTAYAGGQNMLAEVYSQLGFTNLGRFVLFAIYFGLTLNCLFAPTIVKAIGYRVSLVGGSFFYALTFMVGGFITYCGEDKGTQPFYCGNESLIYTVSIVVGILNGAGGAVMWNAQSGYVSGLTEEARRGTYFGIFWSIFQINQIIGNILSLVVLKFFNRFLYFCILTGLCLLATVLLMCVSSVEVQDTETAAKEGEKTLWQKVKEIWNIMFVKNMWAVMVQMFLSGAIISFYSGYLSKIVRSTIDTSDQSDTNFKIASVFVTLGFGEVLSGYSFGKLSDRVEKANLSIVANVSTEIALGFTILAMFTNNYGFLFPAGFFWGFTDTATQSVITAFLSKDFSGSLEGFALYRILQSGAACLGYSVASYLNNSPLYIFTLMVWPFTMLSIITMAVAARNPCSGALTSSLGNPGSQLSDE